MKKKRKVIEVYYYSQVEKDYLLEAIFDIKQDEKGNEMVNIDFVNLMQKHSYLGLKTVFKVVNYAV